MGPGHTTNTLQDLDPHFSLYTCLETPIINVSISTISHRNSGIEVPS